MTHKEVDDLEAYIEERDTKAPGFRDRVSAAERRQAWGRQLAKKRQEKSLSQTTVAARMRTSSSVVSRIESGADVKMSSLQKYAAAVGIPISLDFSRRLVSAKKRPARAAER
jgi:ribosome-binding protein aMBF1 (putative translation factor)